MTESVEAPERIWIEGDGECPYFYHEDELSDVGSPVTEYVRADKLLAEIEARRAEVVKLINLRADAIYECALANIRAEQLAWALKKVAQSLEWYAHGRCRGFDDEAPLLTNEAVELAERTLAEVRGHDDSATTT